MGGQRHARSGTGNQRACKAGEAGVGWGAAQRASRALGVYKAQLHHGDSHVYQRAAHRRDLQPQLALRLAVVNGGARL